MQVGVLAVQGAFAEMEAYWREEGADVFEIRQLADLGRPMDLLALPGGESTVQGKLLNDLGLFDPIKKLIDGGLPVFATCAGLILLAEKNRRRASRLRDMRGADPACGEDRRPWSARRHEAREVVWRSSCGGEAQRLRAAARQLHDSRRFRRQARLPDDVYPRARDNRRPLARRGRAVDV